MTDKEKVEPKFNVGDKIRRKDDHSMTIDIKEIKDGCYVEGCEFYVRFSEQDDWELVEEPVSPVWHDPKEIPPYDSIVVFRYIDGVSSCRFCGQTMKDVLGWAYFKDLANLPNVERIGKDWKEEPILDLLAKYLDRVSHEEAMKTKGAIDRWFADYYPEPVSENLEEEIKKAFFDNKCKITDNISFSEFERIARHFAGWQKQKMMKDAVEGLVVCDELTHGYKDIAMHIPDYLKVGDKVKLIIIKEE